jgi:hypothetical protein
VVNAHAEVVRNDQAMWSSLRYHDTYRFESGKWRFQARALEFFYYVRPADYAEATLSQSRQPHAACGGLSGVARHVACVLHGTPTGRLSSATCYNLSGSSRSCFSVVKNCAPTAPSTTR